MFPVPELADDDISSGWLADLCLVLGDDTQQEVLQMTTARVPTAGMLRRVDSPSRMTSNAVAHHLSIHI